MLLCHESEVEEGQSKGFDLSDELQVFVVRKDDQLYVYKNECPHLGVNLEWQEDQFLDMDGALIQCSTHGALFEIETGHCLFGPCEGDKLTPMGFEVTDGNIQLTKNSP